MAAPRDVRSSSAETLAAGSARRCAYASCSGIPAGRSSGRPSRTSAGIWRSKSSWMELTPIAESISARSASVTAVYCVKSVLRGLGERRLVGGGVEEALGLRRVGEPDLDHPAVAIGVVVDVLGRVAESEVDLDDLAAERRHDVGDRLDGLHLGVGLAGGDGRADLRRIEEHDLAQGVLGVPGDPEDGGVAVDAGPVVLGVVQQLGGVARVSHGAAAYFLKRGFLATVAARTL